MPIKFKNTTNDNNSFQNNADEIYVGAESLGNKVLKTDDVPVINPNQVVNNAGTADIISIYDKSTVFTISFQKSAEYGTKSLPIYAILSVNLTNARNLNQAVVRHSGLVAPIIFDNIWATPSATYADQSAMIAAQGAQTAGLVYNHGMNYWRYLGTVLGTIADYAVVQNIIYTGDAYLTGVNNLNILTFTYKEFHGESTYRIKDAILVNNLAIPLGNEDTNKPVLELLVNLQFNHNRDISINNDLDNSSWWGQNGVLLGEIQPASGASYIDLGGGNFSLRTNTTNSAATGGTPSIQLPSQLFNRIMALGRFTFITRVRRVSPSSANFVYLAKFMNDAQTDGFRCAWELNSGVDNRLWVRINGSNFRSNIGSLPFNQPEWLMTAWTYSNADDRLRHYVEAPTYTPAIPFQLLHTNTVTGSIPITSTSGVFVLNRETTAGQRNNVEYDYAILVADELPQSVIESIKNTPTNVESILRTHYGY